MKKNTKKKTAQPNNTKETKQNKLKDCLTKSSKEELETIYSTYKNEIYSENNLPELINKEDIEKFLLENLPLYFKEYLTNIELSNEEDMIFKNRQTNTKNEFLLSLGFIFICKETKNTYIVPDELYEIYLDFQTENSEANLNKLDYLFRLYSFVNGILSLDFLKDIIKFHHLKINEEGINKYLENQHLKTNQNNYLISELDTEDHYNLLIENKKDIPFQPFNINLLNEYFNQMLSYISNMSIILKTSNDELATILIPLSFLQPTYPKDMLNILKETYKIDKKTEKDLLQTIKDYSHDFRYWSLNGQTLEEYTKDQIITEIMLPEKPKKANLSTCLDLISDESIKFMLENYHVKNKEELKDAIIDTFNEYVYFFSREFAEAIINNQEIDYPKYIDQEDLLLGYFYIYQENEEIKYIIPEEIKKVFKSIDLKDLDKDCECSDCVLENLITNYISMNGVIENKILQKLLKDNHDIELDLKDLDEEVKKDYYIIEKKYYSCISDLDKESLKAILKIKDEFKEYKAFTSEIEDIDLSFDEELTNLILNRISLSKEKQEELIQHLSFAVKNGILLSTNLNELLEISDFQLSDKEKKKIANLIHKYQTKISIWTLNGYSVDELNKKYNQQ